MSVSALSAYLLAAMTAWVPPQDHPEGAEAATVRYESIARDIATIALDPREKPVFAGEQGRVQTALLLASIASFESFYRADVDEGRTTGDKGRSWCIMQIFVVPKTAEGWRGPELVDDRQKCLTAALHLVQESFTICKSRPLADRLSLYTRGACKEEVHARHRTWRAMNWFKKHAPAAGIGELEPTGPADPEAQSPEPGKTGAEPG